MTETELLNNISLSLRTSMRNKNITQTDLAKKTGIRRQLINYYVNGKTIPSLKNLLNMFYVLDLSVDDVIEMFDIIE